MRLVIAFTLAALLGGCGGDEEPAQQQAPPEQAQPQATEPAGARADTQARPDTQAGAQPTLPGSRPAPPPAQSTMDGTLYTVQVAAFLDAGTAREWASRLRAQELPVWTSTAQVGGRTFHRLRVGALPSVADTRRLGRIITGRYHWPVWIAPLTPADRLPVNAVQNTRDLLRGG